MHKVTLKLAVIGLVTFLAAATTLNAQDASKKAKPEKKQTAPTPSALPFHGKISAVDNTAKTITLEGKEKNRTLQITSETKMTKDGKPATFSAAVAGEQIRGRYRKTPEDKLEAISVQFGAKPETTPKKKNADKKEKKKTEKPPAQP